MNKMTQREINRLMNPKRHIDEMDREAEREGRAIRGANANRPNTPRGKRLRKGCRKAA